jgi:hypothetical protein
LKNEGYRRHPARGSQRLPHAGRRLASCRLTKQRLINALAAEIDERAAFSEGTELLYRTKFRRCYRKAYRLVGTSCECQDFTRGQAPEGWCQHRIAAGIAKRVQELLAAPVPVEPATGPEPFPDNDPEEPAPPPAGAAPLPEAAFSLTLKGTLGGVEALLTARGAMADEFKRNLEAITGLLDAPTPAPQAASQGQGSLSPQQHNAAAMHKQVTDFCPVHNVAMRWNTGKDGRKGWYSHRTADGQWCKGR